MLLMYERYELTFLVQSIIVAGLITFATGSSPRLEVRAKVNVNQFSPSLHFLERQAPRPTMSVPSTAATGPMQDGREFLLGLRT